MTTTAPTTDPSAVPCERCRMLPGQWCRTAGGAYSAAHTARVALALATPPAEPPQGARYDAARFDEATYGKAST